MEKKTNRWPILVVGVIAIFFAGILYAWSVIKTPLGTELGWDSSQLAVSFTITMTFFCLGGFFSGNLIGKLSLRLLLSAAGILSFLGFFLSSRLSSDQLWLLYLAYGVFAGSGIGIAYNSIISIINEWFSDIKGTATGILMMGFGASALVIGNMANVLIDRIGWRNVYLYFGIAMGIALIFAAFFLRHPKEGELPKPAVKGKQESSGAAERDYKTSEMLKRPSFIRFFLFLILASAVGNSTISIARDVSVSVGASAGLAATLAGLLSLCNGLGRVIAGILFDKFGQRTTMNIDGIITILAPVIMILAILTNSIVLIAVGMAVTGLSYSFQPTVNSSVISSFYGKKYFPQNFGVANMNLIPTSFVATISGMIYTSTGSYIGPFVLLLIFAVLSFGLNLSVKEA